MTILSFLFQTNKIKIIVLFFANALLHFRSRLLFFMCRARFCYRRFLSFVCLNWVCDLHICLFIFSYLVTIFRFFFYFFFGGTIYFFVLIFFLVFSLVDNVHNPQSCSIGDLLGSVIWVFNVVSSSLYLDTFSTFLEEIFFRFLFFPRVFNWRC